MLPTKRPSLSIVIPAYNEAGRLGQSLEELTRFFKVEEAEILLVIEKSTDRTLAIAEEFATRHPHVRVLAQSAQRGKGHAVKTGMLAAEGEIVFYMDADLSVPLQSVTTFLDFFDRTPSASILIGSRQHPESDIVTAQGWLRRSMGQTFNHLVRLFSGIPWRDTQCGFKAFRREVARELFSLQTLDGFAFDVEILLLARQRDLRIVELPVVWQNSVDSKVHIVRDSLRMMRDIWRLRSRKSSR